MTSIDDEIHSGLRASSEGERWYLAEQVARHGRPALRVASRLLRSGNLEEQTFGVLVLGRMDPRDQTLCNLAAAELTAALSEPQPQLIGEVALNLARLPVNDIVSRLMLLRYDERDGVRLAAAIGLWPHGRDAREALVALAQDRVREVRSWAVFSLVQSAVDDPVVRQTLREAAEDEAPEVRGEAIIGLVQLGDSVASQFIRLELERERVCGSWVFEAAMMLPASDLVVPLRRAYERLGERDREEWRPEFEEALVRCKSLGS